MHQLSVKENPFSSRPGQYPPVLCGRDKEIEIWKQRLYHFDPSGNVVITGLHGLGKTSFLQNMRSVAQKEGWFWVGSDLSHAPPQNEEAMAQRFLSDLATSLKSFEERSGGNYFEILKNEYTQAPGLTVDKLKAVAQQIFTGLVEANYKGTVVAYDEAHLLNDCAIPGDNPLGMLVETIKALQTADTNRPVQLVLSGLPHLFNALTSGQSYTERMFHLIPFYRLSREDSEKALKIPFAHYQQLSRCPDGLLKNAVDWSEGYPCFIQFFGRELFQIMKRKAGSLDQVQFPSNAILDHLDGGSFSTRWNSLSKNDRSFLNTLIHAKQNESLEFSAEEISENAKHLDVEEIQLKLKRLYRKSIIYPSSPGHYAFAAPKTEMMAARRFENPTKFNILRWFKRNRMGPQKTA